MSDFVPRLSSAGMYGNPYWYSKNPYNNSGYGLPNCTAYAWGRFCEIQGKIDPNIPMGDGGQWWGKALAGGHYKTGSVAQLGAIACYSKDGAAGHVGIVEEIKPNGDWVISQSGYYRPVAPYPPDTKNYFWTEIANGTTNKSPWMGKYNFQGFIYAPGYDPNPPPIGGLPFWLLFKFKQGGF